MKKLIFAALAVALVAAACGKKQAPASLSSYDWELYEVTFKDASGATVNTETPPMGVTLSFNDSLQMASGRGGCNRYNSPYEMGDDNTIMFGMPAVTQMACPDMAFETRYLGWLAGVESFEVTHEQLLLQAPGANLTLVYKPEFK